MAMTYRPVDRDQEFLLPPNMIDWLPGDHLVWFVIEAVARLDTRAFHRLAKLGGVGRRGFDPDMLLTLFVYAMAHGVSSSRRMERLCATDVAFRVICAQDVPDHTVLARFRKDHAGALGDLLTQSLVLAAELGMIRLGVVALDGTKISGNASKDTNRTEKHLRKLAEEYLARVDVTDAAEDALFGEDGRGDDTPPGAADRTGRRRRIDAALEQIAARREQDAVAEQQRAAKAAACEKAVADGTRGRGRYPAGTDRVEMARLRWEQARADADARYRQRSAAREQGGPARGRPPVPPDEYYRVRAARDVWQAETAAAATPPADTDTDTAGGGGDGTGKAKPPTVNLTDPESRLLKTRNGWIQGYNCQTAASSDGFILHARATQDANDVRQFIPTMTAARGVAADLAARTGRTDLHIGVLLADAGYDSDDNLAAQGCDRLIADGKRHTIDRRADTDPAEGDPPETATPREKMNHRLRTEQGHQLYQRRSHIIETPNAWLKDRRGLRQFARRGLDAAHSELGFAAAVTNLLKIATRGVTADQLATG